MSHKIRYRLLLLNARLLRNMLAMIGLAGFLTACSGGDKKENVVNQVNQDSLNKVKEQQHLDSIAKVQDDSLAQVRADSLAKARKDSIRNANWQNNQTHMTTKYGVQYVPHENITPTKYGPPSDFQN